MFFYYKREELEKGKLYCVGQFKDRPDVEEIVSKGMEELLKDTIEYESDVPFFGYPIITGNTIRPAEKIDLIRLGLKELEDGEIIDGGKIVEKVKPGFRYTWDGYEWVLDKTKLLEGERLEDGKVVTVNKPFDMIKPEWNKEELKWEERASYIDVYNEYKMLDTPLSFQRMKTLGIEEEYVNIMTNLENIITHRTNLLTANTTLGPSDELKKFKQFIKGITAKSDDNIIGEKNIQTFGSW